MSALCGQTYTDFDVLIVDNGSADGSQELIRELEQGKLLAPEAAALRSEPAAAGSAAENRTEAEAQPAKDQPAEETEAAVFGNAAARRLPFSVRGIYLGENTGFSGAVNAGISEADGEYVILLNNDTEAETGYIAALAAELDRDRRKRLFAVSPKMVQLYHKELLDDAGDGYNLLGWAFQRGVGQPVAERKFQHGCSVFSACAGAAIYRKEALEKLALAPRGAVRQQAAAKVQRSLTAGLGSTAPEHAASGETAAAAEQETTAAAAYPEYFDLQHFAYLEDIDLCYRARIHGYGVRYCPDAVVYHVGSGTSGSKYNAFKVRLAARNNVYLNYKNMPALQLLLNLPGILFGVLVKLAFFTKIGFGKEYCSGFAEGLRTLGACRKVKFSAKNLPNYVKIEIRLIADTFSYAGDFLRRRVRSAANGSGR